MSLAAVHATKKQLGINDVRYRRLLADQGATSSKQLNDDGHKKLIAAMYRSVQQQQEAERSKSAQEKKIWALWYDLKGHLPAKEQTIQYLLGFCKRSSGATGDIKALSDLTPAQAHKAIEALKTRLEQEQTSISKDVPF